MQFVSQWAFQHPVYARLLIIAIELTNAAIGITIGANAWDEFFPNQPSASGYLQAGIVLLTGAIFYLRHWYYLNKAANTLSQRAKHGCIFALFVFNFLLYIVAGGIDAQCAQVFHPSGGVGGSSEVRYESGTGVDRAVRTLANSRILKHKQKWKDEKPSLADVRTSYVLLFILGLALSIGAMSLACNLACAGHGFAALMLFLLGLGILIGGIYYLYRGTDKEMKPHKEMTREERLRARRPFVRTFLGLAIALSLLLLILAIID